MLGWLFGEVQLSDRTGGSSLSTVEKSMARREFIRKATRGTTVLALGGAVYYIADDRLTREARAHTRPDGRPRLPPGQRVIKKLRPMGGRQGDPAPGRYRLRVHGAVGDPEVFTFRDLLKMKVVELEQTGLPSSTVPVSKISILENQILYLKTTPPPHA